MQKPLTATKNGLHRHQIQQHRCLLRSLELEYRYKQRGMEQQQRPYLRALGRLTPAYCTASRSSRTLPALQEAPTAGRSRTGSARPQLEVSTERADTVEPPDPISGNLDRDCDKAVTPSTDREWKWAAAGKPTWATLTFADIRHRHTTRTQAKWQHLLLSSQGHPGTESPNQGPSYGRQGPYSPQDSGPSSSRTLRVSLSRGCVTDSRPHCEPLRTRATTSMQPRSHHQDQMSPLKL